MRAFAYIRLSKWDEATTSPQRQREAVERFCKHKGWELLRSFEDIDVSAYNGKRRPGLEAMLARLGDTDAVVFMRLDRLARSVVEFSKIKQTCQKAGVELVSTDLQIDTSSPMGRAMESIVATFAQLESDTISERTRKMHAYLREQGKWQGGPPPFGWRLSEDGRLVPHLPEQAQIEQAARRYIAGEALHVIARDIGKHHPSLIRMLNSERVQEALPDDLAEQLARALVDRCGRRRDPRSPLLSGIARCGMCGGPLHVVTRKKNRGDWGSYGCRASRGHVHIAQRWLDNYVSEQVLAAIDTGALVKRLEKRKKRVAGTPASREVEARLEVLTIDHYEKGIIGRDVFLRRREGLLKRLQKAKDAEKDVGIDLPRDLAENLAERWGGLSLRARRGIIAAVLKGVEVQKASGHGPVDPKRVRLHWRA
jgi:DNA invertase Pin-like site-specific DNA recombinase